MRTDHESEQLHGLVQALTRTLWGSGGFAAVDTLIKALYIFAFHVPLYLFGCDSHLKFAFCLITRPSCLLARD